MLAYYIKPVLELVPEISPMIKSASVDKEYPTDNKSSVLASAMAIEYMIKIARKTPDYTEMEKVAKAVDAYSLKTQIGSLSEVMIKRASRVAEESEKNSTESYMLKEASFKGSISGFSDIATTAATAKGLYKQASEKGVTPSIEISMYAGKLPLDKTAALKSLSVRHSLTKEAEYIKLAKALGSASEVSEATASFLAEIVTGLDKKAGLTFKGFNFYREAFHTKEAAASVLNIKLAGQDVPYEKLARVGKANIASYIGKDVAAEFDRGPANFKQVAETLPLDLQKVLISLTKNV
jgi:hypothetical protein